MLHLTPGDFDQLRSIFSECLVCLGWLLFIGSSLHKALQPPLEEAPNSLGVSLNDKLRVTSFYHFLYTITGLCGKYLGLGILLTDPASREGIVNLITHVGDMEHTTSISDVTGQIDNVKNALKQSDD